MARHDDIKTGDEWWRLVAAKLYAERELFEVRGCFHRVLIIAGEADGCYWIECERCGTKGPKKHSIILALVAWIGARANGHPRKKSKRK